MKTARANLRWIGLIDLLFTGVISVLLSSLFEMDTTATVIIFTASLALRLVMYWLLLVHYVGPSDRLLMRAENGRPPNEAALQSADRRIQDAPWVLGLATAVAYCAFLPLTMWVHTQWAGPLGLRSLVVPVALLLISSCALGAVVIVVPLLSWTLSDTAGQLHLWAVRTSSHLERASSSIAMRLVFVGICLAASPTAAVMSASLATESHGLYATATQEAKASVANLRAELSTTSDIAQAVRKAEGRTDLARVTLVVQDEQALALAGRPAPSWVTPPILTQVADGDTSAVPIGDLAVHAERLQDGRLVAAVVKMQTISSGVVWLLSLTLVQLTLFGIVCAFLVSRSVSGPLMQTAALAHRAAVEGDLSQMGDLPVSRLDEVGMVTTNLNALLKSMRTIAEAAGQVGAGRLTAELEGEGELPSAFRRMLEQLREVVGEMNGTATELASAAAEIFAASQEQEAASTSHSTGMTEVSQTMDSLSSSAAHVATSVQAVLDNAVRTAQNTDQMVSRIDELTGHANRIGDILEVIRDIADRTDLLALNGSLEASRAGEAGVGFSLVASEMRRLAERVTGSVGDIKTLVADIRESGASTVVATEESRKLADATAQAARSITLVTQQQQSSTEQVSQNVRVVVDVVKQAAAANSQTRASAEALKQQAERLTTLVNRFVLEKGGATGGSRDVEPAA